MLLFHSSVDHLLLAQAFFPFFFPIGTQTTHNTTDSQQSISRRHGVLPIHHYPFLRPFPPVFIVVPLVRQLIKQELTLVLN